MKGEHRGSRSDVGEVLTSDDLTVRIRRAVHSGDRLEASLANPHFSRRFSEGWTVGARYVSDRLRDGDTLEEIELAIKAIHAAANPRGRKRPKSLKK